MIYDLPKRIFIVKKWYEFQSYAPVQSAYRVEFNSKTSPDHKTITNIIKLFEKNGSVIPMRSKNKEPSQKRQIAKNSLENLITEFPNLSIRKASSAIGVSATMIYTVLHDDLHLKPYKYHDWHKLEPHDYEKRLEFAGWFLQLAPVTKNFLICSDEAYFYLTLPANKQNNRTWAIEQPIEGIEVPLNDEKISVWCAISAEKIYGPYFFETFVNQHNYLDMLKNFFWPKHLRTQEYKKYYFQQDGASPHTAKSVQTWLTEKFSTKFIHKCQWPPRSPDLNPCDFFLWGYLKARVYNPMPKTLDDLRINIEREINLISKETLKKIFLNFEKRCNLVISAEGGHIEIK
jgi:hypothetical protein